MARDSSPGQIDNMTPATPHPKVALRRQLRARLAAMSSAECAAASAQFRHQVLGFPGWHQANLILLYAPMPGELDVALLWPDALSAGKSLCFPRFVPATGIFEARLVQDPVGDLLPGAFGIREPTSTAVVLPFNRLDLVLVPGLGFTPDGHRLGRGRGYYDRLLADVPGLKCGVGFDQQLVDTIPCEPHDIILDCVLTPTRRFGLDGTGVLK
jgi:5-formyltetrahydrofolate cyclo-ligase